MTPNNIVNMALILEQDIIALTDHNSCKNCRATVDIGQRHGITVVPGMELCTSEEIHMVCLFPSCDHADAFDKYISSHMMPIKNRPNKFGDQLILNSDDEIIGHEDILLITATTISIEDTLSLCNEYGGACYPAHINRSSFSVLSALGTFPTKIGFKYAEISYNCNKETFLNEKSVPYNISFLQSSDAHYLEDMAEKRHTIDIYENSSKALIEKLKRIDL